MKKKDRMLKALKRLHRGVLSVLDNGKLRKEDKEVLRGIAQEIMAITQDVSQIEEPEIEELQKVHEGRFWRLVSTIAQFIWRRGHGDQE